MRRAAAFLAVMVLSAVCGISFGAPPANAGSKPGGKAGKTVVPFFPPNRAPAVGDKGLLYARKARVVQVFDAENSLVELEWVHEEVSYQSFVNGNSSGQSTQRRSTLKHELAWLIYPTHALVVGQVFETDKIFEVVGTKEIEHAGMKRVVPVIELANDEKIKEEGFRTWTSADGLLAMVGKLHGVGGTKKEKTVTLERRDLTTITIPFALLCKADQLYIQENPVVAVPIIVGDAGAGQPSQAAQSSDDAEMEAAKPGESAPDTRTNWLAESTGSTVRRVKPNVWEEVDNKTGRVRYDYKETLRSPDFIEIFCSRRKTAYRLLAKTMDQKKGSGWIKVADGHWLSPENEKEKDNEQEKEKAKDAAVNGQ